MPLIETQNWDPTTPITFDAADAGGDHAIHASGLKLMIFNGGSNPVDVTVTSTVAVNPPFGPENLVIEVPAGELLIVDVGAAGYRSSIGQVNFNYDSVVDLMVAAVRGLR